MNGAAPAALGPEPLLEASGPFDPRALSAATEQSVLLGGRGFWEELPALIAPAEPGPGSERPPTPFRLELRHRLMDRRAPETVAVLRQLARAVGARLQAAHADAFPGLLTAEAQAGVVRQVLTTLLDGGLAAFRGADAAALFAFVRDAADRVLLRAALSAWVRIEVRAGWRGRHRDLLGEAEVDEVAGDVLSELLSRSLPRFRGQTAAELYAYVRTASRRAVARAAHRRLLHRRSLDRLCSEPQTLEDEPCSAATWGSDRGFIPEPPIPEADRQYLVELLAHEGKLSALAEARGVSRGSVTKMVQRILGRLDQLPRDQREQVGVWAQATLRTLYEGGGVAAE